MAFLARMRVRIAMPRDTAASYPSFCRAWSQVQVGPEPLLGFLNLGVPPYRALRPSGEFVGGDGTLPTPIKCAFQELKDER